MSSLLVVIIGTFSILISRWIYGKWFNQVSLYSFIWTLMIGLYNLKLLNYYSLSSYTYFVIILAFLGFIIGSYTVVAAKKVYQPEKMETDVPIKLIIDNGETLKKVVLFIGIISMVAVLINIYFLLKEFKTFTGILLAGNQIYKMRVDKELAAIPYLGFVIEVGIFFSAIYSAYKGRVTLVTMLPIIAALLKGITSFERLGMLLWMIEFISTFILFRHLMVKKGSRINRSKVIIPSIILLILIILSASIVKSFRGSFERYKGASKELKELSDNPILSPSVYLYVSSHVGVLNQYLKYDEGHSRFGAISFATFYNLMAKLDLVEPSPNDLKGYFIPMWSNTSTYLSNIHADFGEGGIMIIPYLIGLLTSFFWIKYLEKSSILYLNLLVHFFMLIGLTFFAIITQGPNWYLSLLFLSILIPIIENFAVKKASESRSNSETTGNKELFLE